MVWWVAPPRQARTGGRGRERAGGWWCPGGAPVVQPNRRATVRSSPVHDANASSVPFTSPCWVLGFHEAGEGGRTGSTSRQGVLHTGATELMYVNAPRVAEDVRGDIRSGPDAGCFVREWGSLLGMARLPLLMNDDEVARHYRCI